MKRILFALLLAAAPALAENPAETLMQPGLLADIGEESLPRYDLSRQVPETAAATNAPKAVAESEVRLVRTSDAQGERFELTLIEGGQPRAVGSFPVQSANPLLLFFLENVVRNLAARTGGSPYYIRNRIRDALIGAEPDPGGAGKVQVVLHPFAGDPNRDRLGTFGDIAITLRYDPADPARLLQLSADTGEGDNRYTETMVLIGED